MRFGEFWLFTTSPLLLPHRKAGSEEEAAAFRRQQLGAGLGVANGVVCLPAAKEREARLNLHNDGLILDAQVAGRNVANHIAVVHIRGGSRQTRHKLFNGVAACLGGALKVQAREAAL